MLKFFAISACLLCYVYSVMCTPVMKASGFQWSEPKGTGKGNITLIIIPQNNSCGNDTDDMLVVVKSDYQVKSQDMQVLNLVINDTQSGKINETSCGELQSTSTNTYDDKVGGCEWSGNKINLTQKVNFFETPAANSVNLSSSSNNDTNVQNYTANKDKFSDSKPMNVFNLLKSMIVNNNSIKNNDLTNISNNSNTSYKSTGTNITSNGQSIIRSDFNPSKTSNENEYSENVNSPTFDSNGLFLRETLDMFEKLKRNQSYHETDTNEDKLLRFSDSDQSSGFSNTGLKADDDKSNEINLGVFKLTEDGIPLIKEFLPDELRKSDLSYIEGKSVAPTPSTTCVQFFITDNPNNQELTSVTSQESNTSVNETPNDQDGSVDVATFSTTFKNEEGTSTLEITSSSEVSVSMIDVASQSPQAAKENVASNLFSMIGTQIPLESYCNTSAYVSPASEAVPINGVYKEISEMIPPENNKSLREAELQASNVQAELSNLIECPTTVFGGNINPIRQVVPKRVTVEPIINCEPRLKPRTIRTPTNINTNDNYNGKYDINVINNESPKDDFKLAEFIEKAGHEYNLVKPVALLDDDPVVLVIGNKDQKLHGPRKTRVKTKHDLRLKPTQTAPFAKSDVGKVLKMRFLGKNVILNQKTPYRSEISKVEKVCDQAQEVLTESVEYDSTETQPLFTSSEYVTNYSNTTKIFNVQPTNNIQTVAIPVKNAIGTTSMSLEGIVTGKITDATGNYNFEIDPSTLISENVKSASVKEEYVPSTTCQTKNMLDTSLVFETPATVTNAASIAKVYKLTEFPLFKSVSCNSSATANEGLTNANNGLQDVQYTTGFTKGLIEPVSDKQGSYMPLYEEGMKTTGKVSSGCLTTAFNDNKIVNEYPSTTSLKCETKLASTKQRPSAPGKYNPEILSNSIRIPSNAVKEIVIQIVRNKDPVKAENNIPKKCGESKESLKGIISQENPSYFDRNVLSLNLNQQNGNNERSVNEAVEVVPQNNYHTMEDKNNQQINNRNEGVDSYSQHNNHEMENKYNQQINHSNERNENLGMQPFSKHNNHGMENKQMLINDQLLEENSRTNKPEEEILFDDDSDSGDDYGDDYPEGAHTVLAEDSHPMRTKDDSKHFPQENLQNNLLPILKPIIV